MALARMLMLSHLRLACLHLLGSNKHLGGFNLSIEQCDKSVAPLISVPKWQSIQTLSEISLKKPKNIQPHGGVTGKEGGHRHQ